MFKPEITLEHSDSRGEIYSISLPNQREIMLLHSNPGSLRGGHSHDCDELVVVLTGKMRYHKTRADGKEWKSDLMDGETSFNPADQIHMGEFLEDTWVMEFKLAKKGEWRQTNFDPYRERVETNAAG